MRKSRKEKKKKGCLCQIRGKSITHDAKRWRGRWRFKYYRENQYLVTERHHTDVVTSTWTTCSPHFSILHNMLYICYNTKLPLTEPGNYKKIIIERVKNPYTPAWDNLNFRHFIVKKSKKHLITQLPRFFFFFLV